MGDTFRAILTVVLLAVSINLVMFAVRNERVRVLTIEEDFTVRYPSAYRYLCLVIFLFAGMQLLDTILSGSAGLMPILMLCVLLAIGLSIFLLAFVWKIHVRSEYIIHVGLFGIKRQVYYKDIKKAVLTPSYLRLYTTLRTYRMSPGVIYREYFLKRLHLNGVEVERYD